MDKLYIRDRQLQSIIDFAFKLCDDYGLHVFIHVDDNCINPERRKGKILHGLPQLFEERNIPEEMINSRAVAHVFINRNKELKEHEANPHLTISDNIRSKLQDSVMLYEGSIPKRELIWDF